jgi:FolB domain-containing protein
MDQIFIKDLLARGSIGVSEQERSQPQDILINIILFTDTREAAKQDLVDLSVDYHLVAKAIVAFVEKARRCTVEALSEDIAHLCLEETSALGVRVRVEKPGAVRFSKSVGAEIERYKSQG